MWVEIPFKFRIEIVSNRIDFLIEEKFSIWNYNRLRSMLRKRIELFRSRVENSPWEARPLFCSKH